MNFKKRLKNENGGTWLSAILITIIVILVVVVVVSVISLAGTSKKTFDEAKKRDSEQDIMTMLDKN